MWVHHFRFESLVNVRECKYQLELIIRPLQGASTIRPSAYYKHKVFPTIHRRNVRDDEHSSVFAAEGSWENYHMKDDGLESQSAGVVFSCGWQWIASIAFIIIMVTWLCGISIETLQLDNNAAEPGASPRIPRPPTRTSDRPPSRFYLIDDEDFIVFSGRPLWAKVELLPNASEW